jgi:hypothetical protein
MKRVIFTMLIIVSVFLMGNTVVVAQQDLKVKNLEIYPKPAGIGGPRVQLDMHRSYRFIVTIQKSVNLAPGSSFLVKAECIRGGKKITIGKARVGETLGWNIYACFDVYPAEGGAGDCLLRITVDYHNEVKETDESDVSNIWDRNATFMK